MKIASNVLGHPAVLMALIVAAIVAWASASPSTADDSTVYRPLHPETCHSCQVTSLASR